MTVATSHRLEGLEPDNLLSFLALLGLLRALEIADSTRADDEKLQPRTAWDVDTPPLRPRLFLVRPTTQNDVCESAARGVAAASASHDFGDRKDLNYSREECRSQLKREADSSRLCERGRADLFAALMSDAAIKDDKNESVDPTPLCLLFGQGHQHFLERLASVPREATPPPRGKGKKAVRVSEAECLAEALFQPWHRSDPTFSFRWDPEEDVRYALMAGDPTDTAYKVGSQHGANRLAAVGLVALTLVPEHRSGRIRPSIIGGAFNSDGFSFSWPIWKEPATLSTIRSLLAHPDLRKPDALKHLSVNQVMQARRISVGKFMNFTRAGPIAEIISPRH
ncbi:MAG: hypothetical protein JWM26_4347 [Betaproteobacteria bacterium]|nr:hypothetical protein [Betaproteobacteria bacterium]